MTIENWHLQQILPQRYPFLMIDKVIQYIPGEKVVCIKNVTFNEPQFLGHFPERPIMPGVLIIEAAAQTGILFFYQPDHPEVNREYLLTSVKVSFIKSVIPGDQLMLTVTPVKVISEAAILKVECTVSDAVVAKGELVVAAKIISKEIKVD